MSDARRWKTAEPDILESEHVFSLIEAVRAGDEEATQRLVHAAMQFLYPSVIKMLRERSAAGSYLSDTLADQRAMANFSEDAWEITHAACCSMLQRLDTFRGRGFLGRQARFTTWVYAIAQNEMRSVLRRRWRERKRRIDLAPRSDDESGSPLSQIVDPESEVTTADRMAEDEQRLLVQQALEEAPLTPEQKEAIVLFYIQGFKQDRIAKLTGVQVGTVKKRIFDGIRKLRAYVREHEDEASYTRGAKNA